MKNLFYLVLTLITLSLLSCSNDDGDASVIQKNWLGVYNGTVKCKDEEGREDEEDLTFIISKGSSENKIIVDGSIEYTIKDNKAYLNHNDEKIIEVSFELNGDSLTSIERYVTYNEVCKGAFVKQ